MLDPNLSRLSFPLQNSWHCDNQTSDILVDFSTCCNFFFAAKNTPKHFVAHLSLTWKSFCSSFFGPYSESICARHVIVKASDVSGWIGTTLDSTKTWPGEDFRMAAFVGDGERKQGEIIGQWTGSNWWPRRSFFSIYHWKLSMDYIWLYCTIWIWQYW